MNGLPLTPDRLDRARQMLEDRAGYNETARSLGCCRRSLQNHFPGMGLTADEMRERVSLTQRARYIS